MNKHFKRVIMLLLSGGILAGSAYGLKVVSDTTGGIDYEFWTMFDELLGKDNQTPDTNKPGKVTVKSVSLDTAAVKTSFAYGEAFTSEGLKVTATMSDGTTKEVALEDCAFSKPDMKTVGEQEVSVRYGGVTVTYKITVADRELPPISTASLADITKNGKYKVEAESIDLQVSGVEANGGALLQENTDASGGKYLTNYGVKGNYFGFTFTADKQYEDVVIVLRMANPDEVTMNYENVKVYLNYKSTSQTGEIEMKDVPVLSAKTGETLTWESKKLEGITIPAGTNTLTFDISGENVPCIDSIEFYVGTAYQTSNKTDLNVEAGTTVYKEFEDMDISKIAVRADIKSAHGLGDGEAFVETASTNVAGTSGGKSCGAIVTPTEVATMLCLNQKATVQVVFAASSVVETYLDELFTFTLDGEEMTEVEHHSLKGTNNAATSHYWDWEDTTLGWFDLEAGEYEFIAKMVQNNSINVDCFKFIVHSYGEFTDHATPEPDTPDTPVTPDTPSTTKNVITINENGSYVQEAETLDNSGVVTRSDFVNAGRCGEGEYLIETPSTASGSKSISGFDVGTKFTIKLVLEKAAKVDFVMRGLCGDNENYEVSDHLKFTLNEQAVSAEGNLYGAGYPSWSGWIDFSIAEGVSLAAGEYTLTMEVIGSSGTYLDLDCFKFNVTEYGAETGTDTPDPDTPVDPVTYEINITDNGDYVKEAEEFSKEYAVTRSDFEAAYGDVGYVSNGAQIYGFGAGSKFPVTIYAEKDCVIDVDMTMFSGSSGGNALTTFFKLKLDDTALTVAEGNMPTAMTTTALTTDVAVTAGAHTLWIEIVTANFDIDKVTIKAKNYGETVVAPDPAPSYDITISENGTHTVEAESLDTSKVVLQSGFSTCIASTTMASGGACLEAMVGGTELTITFYLESDATVTLATYMAKYESTYTLVGNASFYVDGGDAISVTADEGFGRAEDGSNDWFNWKKVTIGTFELKAGVHTLVVKAINALPNTDYFTLEVSDMAE